MEYKVQILSDKEFENLPFPETEMSLGIADPRTNTAYVRYTGLKGVDQYLVNHEIEHLIDGHGGEHSDHYRNGVYYKGFGDMFGGGQQQAPPQNTLMGAIGRTAISAAQRAGGGSQAPNVQAPGGPQAGQGQGGLAGSFLGGISPDLTSRLKGFFANRNPQGGGF